MANAAIPHLVTSPFLFFLPGARFDPAGSLAWGGVHHDPAPGSDASFSMSHTFLCSFQCVFWQAGPQYWTCLQRPHARSSLPRAGPGVRPRAEQLEHNLPALGTRRTVSEVSAGQSWNAFAPAHAEEWKEW